ncbi:hypothetical protein [Sphingomonas sp. Leaf23]|uniref:hypothetical protein n=1 Tax=Sphingomonas sp. Leaf23 TaxID=1735689 RepID=UPI001F31C127|nr:hypothetical protein [Sphingomonas sp. Leaf23]
MPIAAALHSPGTTSAIARARSRSGKSWPGSNQPAVTSATMPIAAAPAIPRATPRWTAESVKR